jgi:UDP-N-acetyl-D-mannosaminuronic acid transferase (WecB/TagA/CpsF family)
MRVDAVQIIDVIAVIESWIATRAAGRFVALTGMHVATESQAGPSVKQILSSADLVAADGRSAITPVVSRPSGPSLSALSIAGWLAGVARRASDTRPPTPATRLFRNP